MHTMHTTHMVSLGLNEPSRLDTLPTDVLLVVLSYLDTARSFACLAATCKALNQLVKANGWRIFVTTYFHSLSLPTVKSDDGWKHLAKTLTLQSREWERRAFVFRAMAPIDRCHAPPGRGHRRINVVLSVSSSQSIPGNVIVDAHSRHEGVIEKELVVWGSGEDIVARVRQRDGAFVQAEAWHTHKGIPSGYRPGKDDTTCISIMKGPNLARDDSPRALVGRANGDLRMLSMRGKNFGETLMRFDPPTPSTPEENVIEQKEIQALDYCDRTGILAAGTKENILLYPLSNQDNAYLGEPERMEEEEEEDDDDNGDDNTQDDAKGLPTKPLHSISLKDAPGTVPFEFIRSVKFVNRDTIAISLNKSYKPIYYCHVSPTGLSLSSPPSSSAAATDALHYGDDDGDDEHASLRSGGPPTVRALLPIDTSSCAGSGGASLLSSWDDGTIRLSDLRTPNATDRIYQDNFDVSTPINALVSYGVERFVAGSAHSQMIKIFDFRFHHQYAQSSSFPSSSGSSGSRVWNQRYFHTEGLRCGPDAPHPMPKPPTVVPPPAFLGDNTPRCDHARGIVCRWHVLARHDFYRPNCNLYLPVLNQNYHGFRNTNNVSSPVYSLARPSDTSPALYAGLSGVLVELTLKRANSFTPPPFAAPPIPNYATTTTTNFFNLDFATNRSAFGADLIPPDADVFDGCSSSAIAGVNTALPGRDATHDVFSGWLSALETGDGSAVTDVSKCQSVPNIRRQSIRRLGGGPQRLPARSHRLDEWLQLPTELSGPGPVTSAPSAA